MCRTGEEGNVNTKTQTKSEELGKGCNQHSLNGLIEFSGFKLDSVVKGNLSYVRHFIGPFLKTYSFRGFTNNISI